MNKKAELPERMSDQSFRLERAIDPSSYCPGVSIDCVVIGFDQDLLHILLLNWKEHDLWMLPGGFVNLDEDMDQAATRILEERTSIKLPYLTQFHTFGDVNRRDKNMLAEFAGMLDGASFAKLNDFLKQRFISTGYLSLVNIKTCKPTADIMSDYCDWIPVNQIPTLLFDHDKIVGKALEQLKIRINYLPIGIALLPEKFTMKEFQSLYECILDKKLDRGNFQKKILKLGILDRYEKMLSGKAHKAPYLYAFNKERYNELLEKGIGYMN
jgi:8-oxo-dGTP diphosphatase